MKINFYSNFFKKTFDKTHKILDPYLSLVSNLFIILIGP